MALAEMRKLSHDHVDVFTRSIQPLLWLFLFGSAMRHNRSLMVGTGDYRVYLAPGWRRRRCSSRSSMAWR
jgi:ABC-2 type transport system permease protein